MELTGKCKEAFEKWYMEEYNKTEYTEFDFPHLEDFNDLHLTLKNGVLVDFFVHHGFYPVILPTITGHWTFKIIKVIPIKRIETPPFKGVDAKDYSTTNEARTKAIEKANELFNNQKQTT